MQNCLAMLGICLVVMTGHFEPFKTNNKTFVFLKLFIDLWVIICYHLPWAAIGILGLVTWRLGNPSLRITWQPIGIPGNLETGKPHLGSHKNT